MQIDFHSINYRFSSMRKKNTTIFRLCLALLSYGVLQGKEQPPTAQKSPTGKRSAPSRPGKAAPEVYPKTVPSPTVTDIRYGPHERNIIDLWKAKSDKPTPLVLFIHGGGWVNGSKERIETCVNVQTLLDAGISVAAINYRYIAQATEEGLTPPVIGPLHDAARALQHLRHNAKEWNLDAQRVGLTGSSAGACTSLWLAFHDDLADPKHTDPIAHQSTRPQYVAVLRAQTTLDPEQAKEWLPNSTYGGHAFGKKSFAEALIDRKNLLPWIKEYSPYALVTKDDPDVVIFYENIPNMGKPQKDPTHSANHGIGLQKHCKSIGVDCEVIHPGIKNPDCKTATEYLIQIFKK